MEISVIPGVGDAAIAVREKPRGGIAQTRVRRYWPGKAPEWAEEDEEDDDAKMQKVSVLDRNFPKEDDSGVARKDDPRLRRLAHTRIENRDEVRADHRRIRQAEIISTEEEELRNQESKDGEEDEDALEEKRRRRRIKKKNLKRVREEAALLSVEEEDELQEEGEESEYETDSEDEMPGITMIKPLFVPKAERDTIAERERLEAEEQALAD